MTALLAEFRRVTGETHDRLHAHPVLRELTATTLTLPYYGFSLRRFYGFYKTYENLYADSGHELLSLFPAGHTLRWLATDLARLGIEVDSAPILHTSETRFDHARVLAYLYLREGSNLGGTVISRHLEASLGLRPGIDNHFFWGNGDNTGERWRLFRERLGYYEASTDITEAGRHAGELFECLETWLSRKEDV
jgi:heme oxygenase